VTDARRARRFTSARSLAARLSPRPEPPHGLAALRIVVPLILLASPEIRDAPRIARASHALYVAPEGLGWFVAHAPIDARVAIAMQLVAVGSALLAIVGVHARAALAALTASGLYLLALTQLEGSVLHDMHLLWLTALLAASRCDAVWAYDARGAPEVADSVQYAWPLAFARALLGVVYFFPGAHKLARSGLAWALSDNLRNQMYWKWLESGVVPSIRIDRAPWLVAAGAAFVLAFELSFGVLAAFRRTRAAAAAMGLVFHAATQIWLFIPFASLWTAYVVLLPWRSLPRAAPRDGASAPRMAIAVGALLFAAAAAQGARGQMQSFPFACYPTFEFTAGPSMPDLAVSVEGGAGALHELPRRRRSQREWGVVWNLAGVTGDVSPARLGAYARSLGIAPGARVHFDRVYRSVVPEDGGAITGRVPIADVVVPSG